MIKPLIYVAAPYSSSPVSNTRIAVKAGMDLWDTGLAAVIIPHLTMLADLVEPRDVDTWYQFDLDQIAHADAVWRLEGESSGADLEVEMAGESGIPVFHTQAEVEHFCRDRIVRSDVSPPLSAGRHSEPVCRQRHPSNRQRG